MKTASRHLLVEYQDCDRRLLNNPSELKTILKAAAEAARATVVGEVFHTFSPQGVIGVVVIEESHLSIHTWPEYGYAAVDFYTCGDCLPDRAHEVIKKGLGAGRCEIMSLNRGMYPPSPSVHVAAHYTEPGNESTSEYNQIALDLNFTPDAGNEGICRSGR